MLEAACMLSVCGMQGELPQVGKQVYRQLLKSIDRHITSIANNKQWRNYVAAKFRQGREVADPQIIAARIQLADDYTFLINNIAHHQALLTQYNIGLDEEDRNKAMVAATARRVGFSLPDRTRSPQATHGRNSTSAK